MESSVDIAVSVLWREGAFRDDEHARCFVWGVYGLHERALAAEASVLALTTALAQEREHGLVATEDVIELGAKLIKADAEVADLRRQLQTYGHMINTVILENVEADEGGIGCRVCEEYNVTDHAEHASNCPIFKLEQVLETCGFTAALRAPDPSRKP